MALTFKEPPTNEGKSTTEWRRLKDLAARFRQPVLVWLFCLSVLMYGYSHIPFVFGQPFIAEVLKGLSSVQDAPMVSGVVTAMMMGLSLLVSLAAPAMRARFGLLALLLVAFGMQVGLAGALATLGSVFAIALLLLRMVPDSLSTPFILAHIQPMLGDDNRATFLSLKSFLGRLIFAGSLAMAAVSTTDIAHMPLGDLQSILWVYAMVGTSCLGVLAMTAFWLRGRVS